MYPRRPRTLSPSVCSRDHVTHSPLGIDRARAHLSLFTHLIIVLVALSGCTRVHVSDQIETPDRFLEAGPPIDLHAKTSDIKSAGITPSAPWWQSFKSDALDRLHDQLFSDNLQLLQARERVIQLRAIATQTGSQRWPTLNLDLGWSRTKQLNPFSRINNSGSPPAGMAGATPNFPDSFTQDNFRASLAVSYEVDVWGRVSSLTEAAERDAVSSQEDLKAIAVTLSATLTDLWLQLIEVEERRRILAQQLNDDEAQLAVVTSRFQQGLSPHIEVLQQIQQRDRTRAQAPPLIAQSASLKRRIAALLGQPNLNPLSPPNTFPDLPPLPATGLPATVLAQRPDVRAAQARLAAADARVSAAVSARLPGLRIGTNIGYQSFEFKELFDDIIWSLSANLLSPIFQGGRLRAEQQRAEAVLRERLFALRETVMTAYHEVEDALSNERSSTEQLARIQAQLSSAQALFESAQSRYLEGVGDFLTMLSARQGLYIAQLSALSAGRAQLSARVQLHRALAGSWVKRVVDSRPTADVPQTLTP